MFASSKQKSIRLSPKQEGKKKQERLIPVENIRENQSVQVNPKGERNIFLNKNKNNAKRHLPLWNHIIILQQLQNKIFENNLRMQGVEKIQLYT